MATKLGPRWTPTEREMKREEAARLDRHGYNQYDIARRLGCTQPYVSTMLKEVRRQYAAKRDATRDEHVNRLIAQLNDVRKEALEALERSKLDATSRTTETKPPRICLPCAGTGRRGKNQERCGRCKGKGLLPGGRTVTETVAGRLPGSEYMKVLIATIHEEIALRGLEPPKEIRGRLEVAIWDILAGLPAGAEVVDEVERRMTEVLEGASGAAGVVPAGEAGCQQPAPPAARDVIDGNGVVHDG